MVNYFNKLWIHKRRRMAESETTSSSVTLSETYTYLSIKKLIQKNVRPPNQTSLTNYTVNTTIQPVIIVD